MTQKVKKLNDAAIPRLTEISDDALVTVVDKTTGSVSNIEYGKLKAQIIGSLEIGGRNYLPDSETELGKEANVDKSEFVSLQGEWLKNVFDKIGENPCVLSFEARSVGKPGSVNVYSNPGIESSYKWHFTSRYIQLTSEWQRFMVPIGLKCKYPSAKQSAIGFYGTYGSGVTPHIRKIKLERGNVATDWTPAPEDIEARLQVLENQMKVGGGKTLVYNALRCAFNLQERRAAA